MREIRRTTARSPYFDELEVGQEFVTAPPVTLTSGLQATHGAIVGNRVRVALDHHWATEVAGAPVAGPALVWDVSIGQSTVATQHVRANLFYRGLWFSRQPRIGETLHTTTTVEALRENSRRQDREPTGLAVLRITTVDQLQRTILDYRRCAMLLLSPGAGPTGRDDEIAVPQSRPDAAGLFESVADWDLGALTGMPSTSVHAGQRFDVLGGDVVSSAPELARLTGNLARVHHDAGAAGGARLVYGGHTIGLAFHHVCQALPGIVTVAGWHACDHLAPVHEGDVLTSSLTVETVDSHPSGMSALGLQVTTSRMAAGGEEEAVLSWSPVVIVA